MPVMKRFALCSSNMSPICACGTAACAVVVLMALAAPARGQRLPLPPDEQEAVNNAINRGVDYLKQTQLKSGTWAKVGTGHRIGYAVLPGLTLLECDLPPNDPLIQRTAGYLRARAGKLDTTYELALGLLFLDRLGEAKDKKIIRTFALRLIAGQSATGGWGYKCPLLSGQAQMQLLTALRHLDPRPNAMPLIAGGRGGMPGIARKPDNKTGDLTPIARDSDARPIRESIARSGHPSLSGDISRAGSSPGEALSPQGSMEPSLGPDIKNDKPSEAKPDNGKPEDAEPKPSESDKPYVLPERLKMLAVVQDPTQHVLQDPRRMSKNLFLTTTDNSNTQFAILALWTAQRYEVPMNRTLNLIVRRYLTSQNANGSWNYHYYFGGAAQHEGFSSAGAMTCVGLIGLAVGHGLAQRGDAGKPVQDPRIINGFSALSQMIGQPVEPPMLPPMQNLYYLWSLERVAVLYNLPTIGDKDWYRWGAQVLVAYQHKEGDWGNGLYVGSSPPLDTCLALLFLKRANLVKDLTAKLPFRAADLNDGILGKIAARPKPSTPSPPPKKTIPPIEPSESAEADNLPAKPPSVLEDTASAEEISKNDSGDKTKWIILFVALFVIFSAGSLFFIVLAFKERRANHRVTENTEKEHREEKKVKKARRTF